MSVRRQTNDIFVWAYASSMRECLCCDTQWAFPDICVSQDSDFLLSRPFCNVLPFLPKNCWAIPGCSISRHALSINPGLLSCMRKSDRKQFVATTSKQLACTKEFVLSGPPIIRASPFFHTFHIDSGFPVNNIIQGKQVGKMDLVIPTFDSRQMHFWKQKEMLYRLFYSQLLRFLGCADLSV